MGAELGIDDIRFNFVNQPSAAHVLEPQTRRHPIRNQPNRFEILRGLDRFERRALRRDQIPLVGRAQVLRLRDEVERDLQAAAGFEREKIEKYFHGYFRRLEQRFSRIVLGEFCADVRRCEASENGSVVLVVAMNHGFYIKRSTQFQAFRAEWRQYGRIAGGLVDQCGEGSGRPRIEGQTQRLPAKTSRTAGMSEAKHGRPSVNASINTFGMPS